MRRFVVLISIVVALVTFGPPALLNAQDAAALNPFSVSWCDEPVVVPLAVADATSTAPASGVATARGASAVLTSRGPVLQMAETGSRVQVDLGQTLFHAQLLFGSVDAGDVVRLDAYLGRSRQPMNSLSVRGSLELAAEQPSRGIAAASIAAPQSTGQIDLFEGATELFLTNEGSSAIDLVAVAGCPALDLSIDDSQSPHWDADRQRFVAEHTVSFANRLPNRRLDALASQDPAAAGSTVDDLLVDVAIGARGFRSAEVVELELSDGLQQRRNEAFDGVGDTGVLSTPLRLTTKEPQRVRFVVAYEPNFDDPVWSDGVEVPAPTISLRGRVGGVEVGVSGVLRPDGIIVDPSASPSQLVTPAPGLTVEHRYLQEPRAGDDGLIALSERIVVTNDGDAAVTDLVVRYPLADMYGSRTRIDRFAGLASHGCAEALSSRFTGSSRTVIVYDEAGLGVGESCTIDLRTELLPGIVPTVSTVDYETAVSATARSGRREVRDTIAVRSTLRHDPSVSLSISEIEVTNLGDGQYSLVGSLDLENSGDQDIVDAFARIDLSSGLEQDRQAARVRFDVIDGSGQCEARRRPTQRVSGRTLTSGVELGVGESCSVSFALTARPGSTLEGWQIVASGSAESARGIDLPNVRVVGAAELPEAPSIEVVSEFTEPVNNTDGTYRVTLTNTVTNTGDTPLTSVVVADTTRELFADQLVRQRRTGDSCRRVTSRNPMGSSLVADAGTCTVTEVFTVEPGVQLDDWQIGVDARATSTSSAVVEASTESSELVFPETAAATSTARIASVRKVDDRTVRYVLVGSAENTGDVELRNVALELDLADVFEGAPYTIDRFAVDGATRQRSFDGDEVIDLLVDDVTVRAGRRVDWSLVLRAETFDASGPFIFDVGVSAESPSGARPLIETPVFEQVVPMVQLIDRALTATNNKDGTYEIEHVVRVQNAGNVSIPSVDVFTTFNRTFGGLVVDEVETESTCSDIVSPGAVCTSTRTATLRPGSATGPYTVEVFLAARDATELDALVLPEPTNTFFDVRANTPLRFFERPSIEIETSVTEPENRADGTYGVDFDVRVTNTGDVPLYRVLVPDVADGLFGAKTVTSVRLEEGCSNVGFGAPLQPGQTCQQIQRVVARPLDTLGPWAGEVTITADSPSFSTIEQAAVFAPITFTEQVRLDATSQISALENNGDGTYDVSWELIVTNTGDVPLVDILASDAGAAYGEKRLTQNVVFDDCTRVSSARALAPGEQCRIELVHLVQPGTFLGPYALATQVDGISPSTRREQATTESNQLTLTEAPAVSLASQVVGVESVDDKTFRVVTNLTLENVGDIRVNDLAMMLDLDAVFPDSPFFIDGVISNDLAIEEAFVARESENMLAPGQRLDVGQTAVVTLVVSVQPGTVTGPFVGELRSSAVSPAGTEVSTVIVAQVDLPSIAVGIVAQSIDNNRDGSYVVTTSYEVINDGTTPLEFVRVVEDTAAIFAGTNVRTLAVESTDLPVADLSDRRRGDDLVEWGATLDPTQRAVVTTTVLVEPGNVLGPFVSVADVAAISPTGTSVAASILADDPIEFVERPALRVEQRLVGRPAWNPAGEFDVTFAIDVTNDGDVELRSLQVEQDLLNALGTDSVIIVNRLRSETLATNSSFDGLGQPPFTVGPIDDEELAQREDAPTGDIGDTRLLAGWNTLPSGATATIELDLTLAPRDRGVYSTKVAVSARTPAGAGVGADEEIEATTLTRLSVQGELGVAKRTLDEPSVRPDGSVGVTYEILVENAGPFPLSNVEVHDQLSQAFGIGSTFVTSRVRIEAGSPCEGFASSSYDGGTIDPVLVSGVSLQPGARCRIQYDAVVIPTKPLPGPFRSSAFAIASDPFSGTVIDDSTDGTNTDPDGNQEPGDNDIATAVTVEIPEPELTIRVRPLESGSVDATGWFEFGYEITLANEGPIDIDSIRLDAPLDASWSVPFEVVDVESDDLAVDSAFDGDGRSNLVERRNRLRAGDEAVVTLRVRAAQPRNGELSVPFSVTAESVTGNPVADQTAEPIPASLPQGAAAATGLFDSMSTEEKRMLALGAAAMLLFLLIFVVRVLRSFRQWRIRRSAQLGHEAARDRVVVDLRTPSSEDRDRPHAYDVDLTSELEGSRRADHSAHHAPRRRRGRRHRTSDR